MKAIVLLHGWGMHPAVFDELGARLSARYSVQALALPGYAGSPPCAPYTLERLAESVAASAPERCFVAGWSLGGQVALAWARAALQQVEALALLGTTPCFVQRDHWKAAIEASVLQQFAIALHRDCNGTLKRFVSLQAQGDDAARRVTQQLRACLAAQPIAGVDTLARGLDLLLETDLRSLLPAIAQRVLVIHGERDALAPLAAGEHLAHALKRCRLAVVRGAAHAPFISDPDRVSRSMLEFFDER